MCCTQNFAKPGICGIFTLSLPAEYSACSLVVPLVLNVAATVLLTVPLSTV